MEIRSIHGEEARKLKKVVHQQRHENHQLLQCPRCDSLDTKFCYYNNYNFSQPRHFCKNCRRYWTIGGILRDVPIGGGIRKSKNSRPNPPPVKISSSIRDPEMNYQASQNRSDALSMLRSNSVMIDSLRFNESQLLADTAMAGVENAESMALGHDFAISSESGDFTGLVACSNEMLPFPFNFIHGRTPLKWNQVADYYSEIPWKINGEFTKTQAITAEILAQSGGWSGVGGGNEGLIETPNAIDEASWFSFCGLNTPFISD